MDIVSTNVANNISRNVSTNSDGKKVRYKIDCYINDHIPTDSYYYLISLCFIGQN